VLSAHSITQAAESIDGEQHIQRGRVWRRQLTNGKPALAHRIGGVETKIGSM
jgi:hypothetical protein